MTMERIGIYLLIAIIALIARPFVRGWLGEIGEKMVKKMMQAQEIREAAEWISGDSVEMAVIADIWKDREEYEALWIEKEAAKDRRLNKSGQGLIRLGEILLYAKNNVSKPGIVYQNSDGDYILEIEGIYFKKRYRYQEK